MWLTWRQTPPEWSRWTPRFSARSERGSEWRWAWLVQGAEVCSATNNTQHALQSTHTLQSTHAYTYCWQAVLKHSLYTEELVQSITTAGCCHHQTCAGYGCSLHPPPPPFSPHPVYPTLVISTLSLSPTLSTPSFSHHPYTQRFSHHSFYPNTFSHHHWSCSHENTFHYFHSFLSL